MKQAELFSERVEYASAGWIHCQTRAILAETCDLGGCVNRLIRCAICGDVIGEISTRKDLE